MHIRAFGGNPMPHCHATHKKLRKLVRRVATVPLFEIGKNAKYKFGQLMELPIAAALENRSIENQSLLKNRVSADDFYHHFKNKLEMTSIRGLFRRHISQITKILGRGWRQQKLTIAIDKTGDSYWGDIINQFVTGGKRNSSTNYAFQYLTASIVFQGQRFIIYLRALTERDVNDALLVEDCLGELKTLGFQIGTVLMDREFFNGRIILLCNIQKMIYLVPAVKNERFQSKIEELRREGKSLPRIIENYEVAEEVTNLVIYEEKNCRREVEVFGFITNIKATEIAKDVDAIVELYRLRWGIENAHKFQDCMRIPTNTTDGLIRFFFFLLGVIIHNLWVLLNLLAESLGIASISLCVVKDILKAAYGIAPTPDYKHSQRELWVRMLLGKTSTKKQTEFCSSLLQLAAAVCLYIRQSCC